MLKKANISWSVKQVVKMIRNGNIKFDNAVQRGYEWDKKRGSLLIHSLLSGFPVPAFYSVKGEDGKYDMLDGKQRMTTLFKFYSGEFALTDIPGVSTIVGDVEMEVDLNGMKYEELDEDIRDNLDSAMLTVYYFDGITDDEIAEMFFRLNNGKAVSSSVTTRVRAKSKGIIKELGQNELFKMALSQKALESYTNEDIVIKALYVLSGADNLETKNIRKWISETEITEKFALDLACCFERLKVAAEAIQKDDKKIAKKILTKTHMLSLIPFIQKSRKDKVKDKVLISWLKTFYGPADKTSVSYKYNEASNTGCNKKEAVTTRYSELERSYNKMLDNQDDDNEEINK